MKKSVTRIYTTGAVLAGVMLVTHLGGAGEALAGPRGSEFDLTLTPAAGGMEGVGLVRPQDPVAMLFGNPGTLTQLEGSNAFTIGGTFVNPNLEASVSPTTTNPFVAPGAEGKSDLTEAAVPVAAALHRVNDKLVLGMGFSGISGLGSDFREEAGFPPIIADLKLFGANMVGGYQVTPRLSVGAALTVGVAALQAGLTRNSASVNGFGIGGTVGATYDAGPIALGLTYKSPMNVRYDNVIETTPGRFDDLDLEQPQEATFGIATTDAFMRDTHIEFNFRYKNWDDAEGYSSFWKDQYTFSFGGQHKMPTRFGPFTLRAGYSYHSDLAKDPEDLGNTFGNIRQVFLPSAGASVPVSPAFIEVAQATITDGYWKQSVSFGLGYQITQSLRLDLNTSYAFDGEQGFSTGLEADGSLFTAGMGLTWQF